ncbi:hypothetical protein NSB25_15695 [Acetatifactor muris]|uniref:hypothetical protein n=1 Tax=Acetatifactor muris TaxID=879566 RepID=UPI000CD2BB6D|nr:hypothetical protein [Acetatifactor muris]MCI8799429.1 hypothetical protein [Lachnospiraceae bacterium]MCR2048717.1 hypothetical protein [Acetatifactor muris]
MKCSKGSKDKKHVRDSLQFTMNPDSGEESDICLLSDTFESRLPGAEFLRSCVLTKSMESGGKPL